MVKSKAPIIRGPIGQGAPFKMHYNSDGTPNYVLSVNHQKQVAHKMKEVIPAKNSPQIQDRSKHYVSDYVKQLRSGIANVQKMLEKHEQKPAPSIQKKVEQTTICKTIPKALPSHQLSVATVKKNQAKPITNAPAIKR